MLLLLTAALLIGAVAGGTLATYVYDERSPLLPRVAAGFCVTLAAVGLVGYSLASTFALTLAVVLLALAVSAGPVAMVASGAVRRSFIRDVLAAGHVVPRGGVTPAFVWRAVLCVLAVVLLWCVADRSIVVDADGIHTGAPQNFGDLPFHLSVIARFVDGQNIPPEHPSFAGASFTYPFLTDFLAAMFVRAGVPVRDVLVWSTFLLCGACAVLFFYWTLDLTADRRAAWLAPGIALFSGGLGWWRLIGDVRGSGASVWTVLAALPHDYTITSDDTFRWGNLVSTLLITQRGLLLALPLALIVFRLWWNETSRSDTDAGAQPAPMIAAGVITGMLPLIHAHTFGILLGLAGCLMVLAPRRSLWVPFFMWSLALGLPQVWWVAHSSSAEMGRFIAWSFGWDRGSQDVVTFWLKNTGLLIPLLLVALFWRGEDPLLKRPLLRYYLPFTLCFIGPNLFRLAPWLWDNIKILIYWFVGSVPLVALLLARVSRRAAWGPALAGVAFAMLTLAGGLDLWRIASRAVTYDIFSTRDLAFADAVRTHTSSGALILHAPIPNHPVAVSGRRSFMGYPGHVWSHGLNAGSREADITRMYAGGHDAQTLLARYGIDYVVIGPRERAQYKATQDSFPGCPLVVDAGGYRLYRIGGGEN